MNLLHSFCQTFMPKDSVRHCLVAKLCTETCPRGDICAYLRAGAENLLERTLELSQTICAIYVRVKGPHNVGDFSGRSGRSPGPLLTYIGLYICSNAPKEGFPGIRQVFFD